MLLILEAMKMETEIQAPMSGTVKAVPVAKGHRVTPGDVLIEIEGCEKGGGAGWSRDGGVGSTVVAARSEEAFGWVHR